MALYQRVSRSVHSPIHLQKVLSIGQQYTHSVCKTITHFSSKCTWSLGHSVHMWALREVRLHPGSGKRVLSLELWQYNWKAENGRILVVISILSSDHYLVSAFWDQSIVKDNVDGERKCKENFEKWMSWTTSCIKFSEIMRGNVINNYLLNKSEVFKAKSHTEMCHIIRTIYSELVTERV